MRSMTASTPPSASPETTPDRLAIGAGLVCYFMWGLLPLLLIGVARAGAAPFEIVAWRTLWSVPLAALLVIVMDRGVNLRAIVVQPRAMLVLLGSSALIAVNWTVYVWAANSGHILSASLGYYLNPLLNMAAGAVLFKERISRSGMIAIGLAALGVALQGVALGEFPWVSLVLAVSFCAYGIVRKGAAANAQTGLLVECLILAIPAAAYAVWLAHAGGGVFGKSATPTLLLMLCGPATVIPLALFAFAARRLPLTVIGFMQFLAPTLQFMVGIGEGEALTPLRIVSFGFIWAGVAVFAWAAWSRSQARTTLQPRQA